MGIEIENKVTLCYNTSTMNDMITQLTALLAKINEAKVLVKVPELQTEVDALEAQMQASDFWNDPENAAKVSKKNESLRRDIAVWVDLEAEAKGLLSLAKELEQDPDASMEADLTVQVAALQEQYNDKEFLTLFDGRYDKESAIVSFHAGSGGTEAQDWAEMLRRMIMRYAESKEWTTSIIDESRGTEAGIKSCTLRVEGRYAYGHLQSEHGTHRLVRISPFDAESMRHTSFAGLEVIPELEDTSEIEINPSDLRTDIFMSGGKGGQSVNTTYSAVRIVHIPTGITVQCQNERSQTQNKEQAMQVLRSRLQLLKDEEEAEKERELRGEHKSAEWGNQIRSYVLHPYKMVKDLRSRHESSDPDDVLSGNLDPFVTAYLRWRKSGE